MLSGLIYLAPVWGFFSPVEHLFILTGADVGTTNNAGDSPLNEDDFLSVFPSGGTWLLFGLAYSADKDPPARLTDRPTACPGWMCLARLVQSA